MFFWNNEQSNKKSNIKWKKTKFYVIKVYWTKQNTYLENRANKIKPIKNPKKNDKNTSILIPVGNKYIIKKQCFLKRICNVTM